MSTASCVMTVPFVRPEAVPVSKLVTRGDIEGVPYLFVCESWRSRADAPCRSHYDCDTGLWYTQRVINELTREVYGPSSEPSASSAGSSSGR